MSQNNYFYFTVEEPQSVIVSGVSEAVHQLQGVKYTCQELIQYLPQGQFKDCMEQALQGVYWLSKSLKGLDPVTGIGQKVALNDFFDYEGDQPQKKKRKVSAAGGKPPTEVTDIHGAKELEGHPFPYKCYYVNIHDPRYDTKGSLSLQPPREQCHCGFKMVTDFDKQNHSGTTHSGGNWSCYDCGIIVQEKHSC